MRVEQQQNTNIIDTGKQSIVPEERARGVNISQKVEKDTKSKNVKSVNMKDATYLKPNAEEKKSTVEEIEQSATLDAESRKNQMVVLANTTSEEDYARMQEEGFSLDTTTTNTIVTVTDKIKAELAKAGVDISCFGDDLNMEQIEAIAGSPELAAQLAAAFQKADVPVTEENVRDAVEALHLADSVHTPEYGAIKYMIDNHLKPTIENFYKAEYSGGGNYWPRQEEKLDISSFKNQVDTVIRQAGLQVDEETLSESKWLLEQDIPLTVENLQYLKLLKQCVFPIDAGTLTEKIANAIAEGKRPKDTFIASEMDMHSEAEQALSAIAETTEEDFAYLIDQGMDINIKNLEYAIAQREKADGTFQVAEALGGTGAVDEVVALDGTGAYSEKGLKMLTARRQLEEIRLVMTVQANYSLLKKGVEIHTEPLEQLVEQLRAEENAYYQNLLQAQGVNPSEENVALFRETTEKIEEMKSMPAYVLGSKDVENLTIQVVHKAGAAMQDIFRRANERYETLMTAPRKDMGDSIQKAFRNVDAILQDLDLETSEENRRAVRILGYNGLDITEESVAQMKAADEEVQRVFRNMTPAVVTQLIKKEIIPLDMEFEELNRTAEKIAGEMDANGSERFAEFLWKLEKNDAISEEERKSYIGIYRLIHQVEATDGAAVGALVNQGAEITMRNLMMAVRNERRNGKMDYAVDENFGERETNGYYGNSVTSQVETAYQNNCLKDVADMISPEKIRMMQSEAPEWEKLTPEQLKQILEQIEGGEDFDRFYIREQLEGLRESARASCDIYDVLQKYDLPNTVENVTAMEAMTRNRNKVFRQIFGEKMQNKDGTIDTDDLEEMKQEILNEFGEAVKAPEEMAKAQENLGKLAENVMKTMIENDEVTSLDVREMRLLSAQLSINSRMAKEEQYSVPVLVSDGVVNVSLKIVRGVDKKGTVDIMLEDELRGKIAATFQAKEKGIHGLIVADQRETRELLEQKGKWLEEQLTEEDTVIHFAYVDDLDINHVADNFVEAETKHPEIKDASEYQAQTTRLYHIAESFIRIVRDTL